MLQQNAPAHRIPMRNKILRAARFLANVKEWRHLTRNMAGPQFCSGVKVDATAYGKRMRLDLSNWVEWNIYMFGGYEAGRIRNFLQSVNGGGVLLDIGANIGNHALALSDHFTGVHAFEPNPLSTSA